MVLIENHVITLKCDRLCFCAIHFLTVTAVELHLMENSHDSRSVIAASLDLSPEKRARRERTCMLLLMIFIGLMACD